MIDIQTAPVRRVPIVLCLALIAAYPFAGLPLQGAMHALVHRFGLNEMRFSGEAIVWLYAAIVLGIALFWERRTLASIGLGRFTLACLWFGIGATVAMFAFGALANIAIYVVLHRPQHTAAQAEAIVGGSVPYAIALAVRAGVVEELFYRGLAIEQLTAFTGRR